MTTPPLDTDVLAGLVAQRRACLAELRNMAQRQLELIEQGNVTGLLDLLSLKQRSLTELQRSEAALVPFRSQDPQRRRWRSPAHRAACASEAQQCEAMVREIVSNERTCEEALVRRRDESAARLQHFRTAGQAKGAYAAASRIDISQIDLFSER